MSVQLAFTADLHWGHGARGLEANELLVDFVHKQPPDVLVLAGDVGTAGNWDECLQRFADLPCRKAVVPGNHDLWVTSDGPLDSLQLYREDLPRRAALYGFHYLDHGPLILREADLALVGCINWYDYSWSLDTLRRDFPDELHRLASKRFTRGRHNDANFIRWPLDDERFTAQVVQTLGTHLDQALTQVKKAIVVVHHPPLYDLSFPRPPEIQTLDSLLWDALVGNTAMEELLRAHADRIAFVFCGHTHRAREANLGPIRGYNIGGDYHFKRLLWLDYGSGAMGEHIFGNPEK